MYRCSIQFGQKHERFEGDPNQILPIFQLEPAEVDRSSKKSKKRSLSTKLQKKNRYLFIGRIHVNNKPIEGKIEAANITSKKKEELLQFLIDMTV